MRNIIIVIVSIVTIFAIGIFIGKYLLEDKQETGLETRVVTSQSILEKLQEEGFLVTQSSVVNQKVVIDRSTGVAWKDFFWGQTLEAYAAVKVNSGVDLSKLKKGDIVIKDGVINITLPQVEHKSVELVGEIFLDNQQGVFKRVFDDDDGYNTAMAKLKDEALKSRQTVQTIDQIQKSTKQELTRLFRLIDENLQVEITFEDSAEN